MQAESLYKLCKVWGYVKYRHPSIIDGTLNWDAELFRIMPDVLDAKSPDAVNEVLSGWLDQFAFTEQTDAEAQTYLEIQEEYGITQLDTSWIEDTAFLGTHLSDYLQRLSRTYLTEKEHSYAAFSSNGVLDLEHESRNDFKTEDDGMKLLALFRFWNIYEYFSPNITITKTDWDEVLKERRFGRAHGNFR